MVGLDSTMGPGVFDLSVERLLHRRYDLDHRAYSSDGNVSTPADMCRLFQRIHSNEVLSPEGIQTFLDVHKNQQLRTVIPQLLPAGTVCAHKTGQFESVSCDVGIVYAENGPYAIAIMANEAGEDRTELNRALAAISRSVFDRFARSGT
jgi:beta-lactamase class A